MRNIPIHEFERICVDAVRWTKQNNWNDGNSKRAFRILVKVSGEAHKGFGEDSMIIPVKDVLVEFRLVTLSGYKGVYVKFDDTLFKFFYEDRMKEKQWNFDKTIWNYADMNWARTAYHDSCWTEGFRLQSFFTFDSTFEILEMGIGFSSYVPTKENEAVPFLSYKDEESLITQNLVNFQNWAIDCTNYFTFWNSFMKEMSMNNYVKGFDVQLTNVTDDQFREKNLYIYYDYHGKGVMISKVLRRKDHTLCMFIDNFTEENLKNLFPGYKINFVTDNINNHLEYLGWMTERNSENGFTVQIKNRTVKITLK